MSSESEFYATIDNVKQKLNIPPGDNSIDERLQTFAQEINGWIETEIRKKVGNRNEDGDPIDINFTITSNPEIDVDIRSRADDLLEGKFRFKTTNDSTLWDDARKEFKEYLTSAFGWGAGESLATNPTLPITPTTGPISTVITVSGINWAQFEEVTVTIGGIEAITTPTVARADSIGDLGFTFIVPTNVEVGTVEVRVLGQNIPRGRTQKLRNVEFTKFVVT